MQPFVKTVERIAVAAGILLLFLVALELLQAYETLWNMHPWAGYGFLGILGLVVLYLLWQIRAFATLRAVPRPPELPEDGPFKAGTARRFVAYLKRVSARLEANPLLMDEFRPQLWELRGDIAALEKESTNPGAFRTKVVEIERDRIAPLLEYLDKQAEAVVGDSVGIVSVGTALSPYRSADFFIVLTRNIHMVNRILRIYRAKPSPRETVAVFYDIARVVAAVNILNAMDQVWTGLGRHVPLIGTWGEAVSEGLFSGLLTSVAGHAAIDRSRSYKPWSRDEAARKYRGRLVRWGRDVWNILMRHGIDRLFGKQPVKPSGEEPTADAARGPLKRFFGGKTPSGE